MHFKRRYSLMGVFCVLALTGTQCRSYDQSKYIEARTLPTNLPLKVIYYHPISGSGEKAKTTEGRSDGVKYWAVQFPTFDTILGSRFISSSTSPIGILALVPQKRTMHYNGKWGIPALATMSIPFLIGWPGDIFTCELEMKAVVATINGTSVKEYRASRSAWAANAMFWGYSGLLTAKGDMIFDASKAACSQATAEVADDLYGQIAADAPAILDSMARGQR